MKNNSGQKLLAIDIGNTSALFAFFSKEGLKKTHRIPTDKLSRSSVRTLSTIFPMKDINAAVIASVVPGATKTLQGELLKNFDLKVLIIGKDLKIPIKNKYKNPKQVGIDRLMNAVAAHERYKRDTIVIDFGTAITFDIVSKKGEYLGGVIAPGIEISLEALYQRTALLPNIKLVHPRHLIGKDTIESIRVGCSYGIGGLCDRIVEELKKKLNWKPLVIATGGYAPFMASYCRLFSKIEPNLTLEGILITFKKSA